MSSKFQFVLLAFVLATLTESAEASTNTFFKLGGHYSYSRIERADTGSGGNFSLISQDGYQAQLDMGQYFSKNWHTFIKGTYFAHN